jgi:hypothetical protein
MGLRDEMLFSGIGIWGRFGDLDRDTNHRLGFD